MYLGVDCAGLNNRIHRNTKRFNLKIIIFFLLVLLLHCVWSVWLHFCTAYNSGNSKSIHACTQTAVLCYRHRGEAQPCFGGTAVGDELYNCQNEHHAACKEIARRKRHPHSPSAAPPPWRTDGGKGCSATPRLHPPQLPREGAVRQSCCACARRCRCGYGGAP